MYDKEFNIIDPACGTGGFLTENFKVLKNNYEKTNTYANEAKDFLAKRCFFGKALSGGILDKKAKGQIETMLA